jgi:hypothetical protein
MAFTVAGESMITFALSAVEAGAVLLHAARKTNGAKRRGNFIIVNLSEMKKDQGAGQKEA